MNADQYFLLPRKELGNSLFLIHLVVKVATKVERAHPLVLDVRIETSVLVDLCVRNTPVNLVGSDSLDCGTMKLGEYFSNLPSSGLPVVFRCHTIGHLAGGREERLRRWTHPLGSRSRILRCDLSGYCKGSILIHLWASPVS